MIWTCPCGCRVDDPSNGASGTTCSQCMAKGVAPVAVAPSGLDLDALEAAALVVKQHADTTKRLDAQMTRLFIGADGPRLTLDDGTAPSPFDPDVVLQLVTDVREAEAVVDAAINFLLGRDWDMSPPDDCRALVAAISRWKGLK